MAPVVTAKPVLVLPLFFGAAPIQVYVRAMSLVLPLDVAAGLGLGLSLRLRLRLHLRLGLAARDRQGRGQCGDEEQGSEVAERRAHEVSFRKRLYNWMRDSG